MHVYLSKEESIRRLQDASSIEVLAVRNFRKFWQAEWWLYGAIRLRSRSPWNHCVCILHGPTTKTIYHIIGRGVVFEDYQQWLEAEPRTIESLASPITLTPKMRLRVLCNLNAKYDYISLILAAFGISFDSIAKGPFYCYELVAFVLQLGDGPWTITKLRVMIKQLYFNS